MTRYKEEAEALYQRVERKIGKKPNQKDIKDFLGKFYFKTKAQDAFIDMAVNLKGVGSYTTKEGVEVAGYTRTHQAWNSEDEMFLLEQPLEVALVTLKSKHTKQAIQKKRQRLLKRQTNK